MGSRIKQKVLAGSWHPGGINAIIPVIEKLQAENKVDVVTIGHEFSEPILTARGISYKTILDYGLNKISMPTINKILIIENPNLVLTGTAVQDSNNPNVLEHMVTWAAAVNAIPSVAVLDFWANYSQRFSDILGSTGIGGTPLPFLPDVVAVLNEYAKKAMLAEKIPETRMVITGNPYFDNLEAKARDFKTARSKQLRQLIGLDADILLTYAGNTFKEDAKSLNFWDWDNLVNINLAVRSIETAPVQVPFYKTASVGIAVKLHPRTPAEDKKEIASYIETFCKDSPAKIVLVENELLQRNGFDIQDLILSSDAVMTPNSTVAYESVFMDKPVISLQPNLPEGKDMLAQLTSQKYVPVAYTHTECIDLVKRLITESEYRNYIMPQQSAAFKKASNVDGKAAERVANLVYKMIGLQS